MIYLHYLKAALGSKREEKAWPRWGPAGISGFPGDRSPSPASPQEPREGACPLGWHHREGSRRGDPFTFTRGSFRWNLHPKVPETEPWSRWCREVPRADRLAVVCGGSSSEFWSWEYPRGKLETGPVQADRRVWGRDARVLRPLFEESAQPCGLGGGGLRAAGPDGNVRIKSWSPRAERPGGGSCLPEGEVCGRSPGDFRTSFL